MALASPASEIGSAKSRIGNRIAKVSYSRVVTLVHIPWTAARTGELAVFGVAHVLLQQRVTAFGSNCEGARGTRLCETECTELGCNISWNWRRIAFRVCRTLQFPQPVKIVRSQVRVHDQLPLLRPKLLAVELGTPDVDVGVFQQAFLFVRLEFAHDLARRADDEDAVGIGLAFGNEGAGGDDAAAADDGVVHDDRADADERAVADGAAVEHRLVADRDVFP